MWAFRGNLEIETNLYMQDLTFQRPFKAAVRKAVKKPVHGLRGDDSKQSKMHSSKFDINRALPSHAVS